MLPSGGLLYSRSLHQSFNAAGGFQPLRHHDEHVRVEFGQCLSVCWGGIFQTVFCGHIHRTNALNQILRTSAFAQDEEHATVTTRVQERHT